MKALFIALSLLASSAYAGCDGFGPGPVNCPPPVNPVGPAVLCVGDAACQPIIYEWVGKFFVATSHLPTGYEVIGWGGPCHSESCPDIGNQAFRDLSVNADQINRAWYR